MNKLLVLVLVVTSTLVSSCLTVSGDYTPDVDIREENLSKYAITYSVSYWSSVAGEDVYGFKETCEKWIKGYLEESGAFSSVAQRDISTKSNYHIHYRIRYYLPWGDTMAVGFMGALSLFTIPVYTNYYYDISATVFLNNEIILSPATTERMRTWYWLPFIPVGLVCPRGLVRDIIEKKCLRFLTNEILDKHKDLINNPPKKTTSKTTSTKTTSSGKTTSTSNSSSQKTSSNKSTKDSGSTKNTSTTSEKKSSTNSSVSSKSTKDTHQ